MDNVNIYTLTECRQIKASDKLCIYVLEMPTEKGPYTFNATEYLCGVTVNQAELRVLILALKKLKHPCRLTIYTDSSYIESNFGRINTWRESGWKNAHKKDVANREEWEALSGLTEPHEIEFRTGAMHEYRNWMNRELHKENNNYGK